MDEWAPTRTAIAAAIAALGGPAKAAGATGYSLRYMRWLSGMYGPPVAWSGRHRAVQKFRALGFHIPAPLPMVRVVACPCGQGHARKCALGRSTEPEFLKQIRSMAVPWLAAHQPVIG